MKPLIKEKKRIILAGMDFFGNPFEKAGGWSEQNEIGRLWHRFMSFYKKRKEEIKGLVSEGGYELWIDLDVEKDPKDKYIFVGVDRYAAFTLKGREIKSNWSDLLFEKWLPESGLKKSFDFLIEYYDDQRFKGMEDPNSELDLYVPIR